MTFRVISCYEVEVNRVLMTEDEIREEYTILEKSRADPQAFGVIYERYFDRIFNFVYRQTDDEDITADLTSQTFLIALKNVSKYQFRGVPFSAWLYKIASNEVNKHYRKNKHHKIFSLEEGRVLELMEQVDDQKEEDRLKRMLGYLNELPADMLEILYLRFFEEKDFKEIAFILDISESGAKMRTYRALDKLRKNFRLKVRYDGKK